MKAKLSYHEVVKKLEDLSIMPKTMPGLEKIRAALQHKHWFKELESEKIITVAGTNGKGTTSAALEALLLSAGQKTGLYTSPHLITTTERIRVNGQDITQEQFVELYESNRDLIAQYELTHFESLTLMAADFFFSYNELDYVIFEVGLGGLYDATNVFPHKTSVITKLGLDHQNILGKSILEIAQNKFGIIKDFSQVIHHQLPVEVEELFKTTIQQTKSKSFKAEGFKLAVTKAQNPKWILQTIWGNFETNIPGERAAENIMTALTAFQKLGFKPEEHLLSLSQIRWQGRMQKIEWPMKLNPELNCPVYLSGDHNIQGVESLIDLLRYYEWETLHIVVGIGVDKNVEEMFELLKKIPNSKIYLTQTPFKGRAVETYPEGIKSIALGQDDDPLKLLNSLKTNSHDIVLVTGSLYLVGLILSVL